MDERKKISPKTIIAVAIISVFLGIMTPFAFGDKKIKQPNVSGQFYPANPQQLSSQIEDFFQKAQVTPFDKHIDILIAPHAGYVYSGGVAAHSFKAASRNQYDTIVILAPSHFFGFDGISVWDEGAFETPLGMVEVDSEITRQLIEADPKSFYFEPRAFEQEHSLEVEIPFLQKTFSDFKIVPVVMGQPNLAVLRNFALALYKIMGDRKDVLVVVSTDMSHYHEETFANEMDSHTIEAIKGMDADRIFRECRVGTMEMCGCIPVVAALLYAKEKGLNHSEVLKYATSGDVTGDTSSVVGYTSAVLYANPGDHLVVSSLTLEQKRKLIDLAKKAIESYVRGSEVIKINESDPRLLLEEEGIFVTIRKHGELRGCIGNILGKGPMCTLVRDMAISSATEDPRFEPLREDELEEIEVEVSVLSKPWEIKSVDEIELGVHGVIVSQGLFHHGIFLPEVATDTGWTKEEFLSQLCSQKAGLPRDAWKDPRTKIEIFTSDHFLEEDVK